MGICTLQHHINKKVKHSSMHFYSKCPHPVAPPAGLPYYVVLMPYHATNFNDNHTFLIKQINALAQQAFTPLPNALQMAQQRIWVVIGLNCRDGQNVQQQIGIYVNQLACMVLPLNMAFAGFTWSATETPYQLIRERVKDIAQWAGVDALYANRPNNPFYLVSMDADFDRINGGGVGAFHLLDQRIQALNLPDMISLGYSTSDENPLTVRFAVHLDHAIREEMGAVLRKSPYYSEAFFATRFVGDIRKYSFIARNRGHGFKLESLAWIDNGIQTKVLNSSRFVYVNTPSIHTSIERLAGANLINTNYQVDQAFLRAIRGLAQSHLDPLACADRLAFAHPFPTNWETKGALCTILNAFDPIHLMQSFPMVCQRRDQLPGFHFWRNHYRSYVTHLLAGYADLNLCNTQLQPGNLTTFIANTHSLAFANGIGNRVGLFIWEGAILFLNRQIRILRESYAFLESTSGNQNPALEWTRNVAIIALRRGKRIFDELQTVPMPEDGWGNS